VSHGQSCSIGAAIWDGLEEPAAVISRADQALYEAKRSGRDRIAFHRDGAVALADQTTALSPVLEALRIAYQPIVDLGTGEMVGMEALSRFEGRDPRTVFDMAARDGTVAELEAAAIRTALAGWGGAGALALNVSLPALLSPAVQAALPDDLTSIALEITETDLVDYGPETMRALDDVRARGVLIAIDDFGVGFSNVHRIAMIRPDVVKLDLSLVRGVDSDPVLQAVASSCVLFAELTGAKLVAEGIETEAERECMQRLGVHFGQGYLLGRPGPLSSQPATGPVPG
jgi:EAL domain-containing protein (putative c-di-GMP-specific phosphodiesterase class I)